MTRSKNQFLLEYIQKNIGKILNIREIAFRCNMTPGEAGNRLSRIDFPHLKITRIHRKESTIYKIEKLSQR